VIDGSSAWIREDMRDGNEILFTGLDHMYEIVLWSMDLMNEFLPSQIFYRRAFCHTNLSFSCIVLCLRGDKKRPNGSTCETTSASSSVPVAFPND
jgi:hypothetical protein